MVDASLVIEGAVAVGTIGLSLLTVYQTQLLIRERRASQARELAEKIYTPMRVEVAYWQDVELVRVPPWKFFNEQMPCLTLRVPKELVALLDQGDQIMRDMGRLEEKVRNFCGDQLKTFGLGASVGETPGDNFRADDCVPDHYMRRTRTAT